MQSKIRNPKHSATTKYKAHGTAPVWAATDRATMSNIKAANPAVSASAVSIASLLLTKAKLRPILFQKSLSIGFKQPFNFSDRLRL